MGKSADAEIRKQIGTLLETPNFYHYLSGEKNLRIAAHIKGKGFNEIDNVLQKVNLISAQAKQIQYIFFGHEAKACYCILFTRRSASFNF